MRKLYRQHRGSLADSMETCVEVSGIEDIIKIEKSGMLKDILLNIHIDSKCIDDSSRLGEEWAETHYLLADFEGHTNQCIGMCNFVD